MGKSTGFLDYEREDNKAVSPKERIKNFNEFHEALPLIERKKQAARCMNCGVSFCQSGMKIGGMFSGCPLNNLIPEFNDLIYRGNLEEAYYRLKKTSSFPEFTGRVCPALCEKACTCNLDSEPVTTRANELSIIEYAYENGLAKANPPKVRTGKNIAIVGSGPSGLAAADMLNRRGHNVTVYERNDRVGGLLMYGIPNMKLEKSIVKRKTDIMEEEGVRFITGVNVGRDITAKELKEKYDRVILCCGASNPRDISVKGRDALGIYFAVDFLRATTKSLLDSSFEDEKYIPVKGKNVVVIGGGDTGNDCVGTSIRLGAKSVLQLEMMPKPPEKRLESNPWPEWPKVLKTDYGQEEAIEVFGKDPREYLTTVKEFIKDDKGSLKKVKLVKLESKFNEETKRFSLEEIEGSEYEVKADIVLIAAGFLGSEEYVTKEFNVDIDGRSNVMTSDNYETNIKDVFSAGDMRRGQSLVVWAIKEGREVAKAVDYSLMGYTNL